MAHTVIGDFVIFCLIVRAAYKSQEGGHLHDLINLLQVIGGFVGAFATALVVVTHKSNKADYEAIIKELTVERDEVKKDYYKQKEKTEKLEEELRKRQQALFFLRKI